jgi:hypothetical protein
MRRVIGVVVAFSIFATATSAVAAASYPIPSAEQVSGDETLFGGRGTLLLPIVLLAAAIAAYLILRDRGDDAPVTP